MWGFNLTVLRWNARTKQAQCHSHEQSQIIFIFVAENEMSIPKWLKIIQIDIWTSCSTTIVTQGQCRETKYNTIKQYREKTIKDTWSKHRQVLTQWKIHKWHRYVKVYSAT